MDHSTHENTEGKTGVNPPKFPKSLCKIAREFSVNRETLCKISHKNLGLK